MLKGYKKTKAGYTAPKGYRGKAPDGYKGKNRHKDFKEKIDLINKKKFEKN